MGTVAFRCEGCGRAVSAEASREADVPIACPRCGRTSTLHAAAVNETGGLRACVRCCCPDLYRHRDFDKRIGLAVVALAAVLAPFTYYLSLLAAAAIDAALYLRLPDLYGCYRCRARHRRFAPAPRPEPFDPAVADRWRLSARRTEGAGRPG
jgi:phage FluMu protein Com